METQTPHRINYTAPCSPRIIIPETTSFESHQQNTHQNTSNANSSQPNPPHCKTKKMGESIGNFLGKVEAAEFYEYPGKKMIIKVKVSINVYQPIQTGILIGSHKDGTTWIDFRYENLPQVCFKCGILGHDEKLCQNEPQQIEGNAPLGPWIRSNQFGRRVMEEKDKKIL
jgi:hypothetical protein